MPELPEVETLCRQLQPVVLHKQIVGFEILDPRLGNIGGLTGKKIVSVVRKGKALEINLDDSTRLLLHLRMTGRLLWQRGRRILPSHTRFIMALPSGRLLCIDPRRFATLAVSDNNGFKALISDPLQDCPASRLLEIARAKKLPVKSFLMDQRIIAGIGNIYACEILHEAAIDPRRQSYKVSRKEWENLSLALKDILARAIACRGTSISDWRDLFGREGEYQNELKVYGREGLPCHRCHGIVQRLRLGGRGTYFCPSCQS